MKTLLIALILGTTSAMADWPTVARPPRDALHSQPAGNPYGGWDEPAVKAALNRFKEQVKTNNVKIPALSDAVRLKLRAGLDSNVEQREMRLRQQQNIYLDKQIA